jgi:hypothetical protein
VVISMLLAQHCHCVGCGLYVRSEQSCLCAMPGAGTARSQWRPFLTCSSQLQVPAHNLQQLDIKSASIQLLHPSSSSSSHLPPVCMAQLGSSHMSPSSLLGRQCMLGGVLNKEACSRQCRGEQSCLYSMRLPKAAPHMLVAATQMVTIKARVHMHNQMQQTIAADTMPTCMPATTPRSSLTVKAPSDWHPSSRGWLP